jgi:hypothetical protein
VPGAVDTLGHAVTLVTGDRPAGCSPTEVRLVRADAGRARRGIPQRIGRRSRIVAAAVTSRAGAGRELELAVDVELRSHEALLGVDHFGVAGVAALRLWMRQRRRETVTGAAGALRALR